MIRIRILVEGQTEETFVNEILYPHLNQKGVYPYAFLFRKKRGSFRYQRAQKEILNSLKEDAALICTTMVDFYNMPQDWPGRKDADSHRAYLDKAVTVEDALLKDITAQMGDSWNRARFIPYVQMHEFEALLFSDTAVLADRTGQNNLHQQFQEIRKSFSCPEEINDNYQTCPSRRIRKLFAGYQKVIDGISIAKKIGLAKIRSQCPHFNEWISKLEGLGRV